LSSIPFGLYFESDFSLSTGRNLSRKRDNAATSGCPDFFYFKRRIPLVLYYEIMPDIIALKDLIKFILIRREIG
jgi:hypothetical protein